MYRVVLTVDGQEYSQGLRVESDPSRPDTGIAEDVEEIEEDEAVRTRIDD
jgi:hypothetical protein